MRHFNCLTAGFAVLLLSLTLLPGCVSESEYEALQGEHAALVEQDTELQAECDKLKADCEDMTRRNV